MKTRTRCAAALLALCLCLGLSACSGGKSGLTEDDAMLYVDGLLRETYLGKFDRDYMELVGIDADEAQATYESSLETEAYYFIQYYAIEYPTDEIIEEIEDLYADIYAQAKFEVVSAARQEDGSFSVKVTVEPIDIVQLVEADFDEDMEPFYTKYPSEVQGSMTEEEYQAMDQEWAEMILDLYRAKLPELGHEASKSVSVQLEKGEDELYTITDDDFMRINELIVDYS